GAIQVTSSRKGAKSRTNGRKLRSTRTKARTHVDRVREPELEKRLEARTHELNEAREQQAATAEVLRIISSSPGKLEPVFETILANATRLCQAKFGILYRYDGNAFQADGLYNVNPAFADHLRREPPRPDPRNAVGRLMQTRQPVHIPDVVLPP